MSHDLTKYMEPEVIQQVIKDLVLAGFTPPPIIDYQQAYEPLLSFFREEINTDPTSLRTFLYTIDLSENRVGQALAGIDKQEGAAVFLELCLQRASEKIAWRKKFKEGNY